LADVTYLQYRHPHYFAYSKENGLTKIRCEDMNYSSGSKHGHRADFSGDVDESSDFITAGNSLSSLCRILREHSVTIGSLWNKITRKTVVYVGR